jgi:hypothetical protein
VAHGEVLHGDAGELHHDGAACVGSVLHVIGARGAVQRVAVVLVVGGCGGGGGECGEVGM